MLSNVGASTTVAWFKSYLSNRIHSTRINPAHYLLLVECLKQQYFHLWFSVSIWMTYQLLLLTRAFNSTSMILNFSCFSPEPGLCSSSKTGTAPTGSCNVVLWNHLLINPEKTEYATVRSKQLRSRLPTNKSISQLWRPYLATIVIMHEQTLPSWSR